MISVLICERFAVEALLELKKNKNFLVQSYSADLLSQADALVIRSQFKITSELLEQAKNLKLIVTCTSGFDHINLEETKKRNITVMYTPDANTISAAELTWSLLTSGQRRLSQAYKNIKAGEWRKENLISHELAGRTLGIVGLGRIGSRVTRIAKAFEMNVMAFDPYQNDEVFANLNCPRVSYEEVLKQSDILSFHVPGTFETKNMFSRSQIEYVAPEIMIINTSRGQVINEDDLAQALTENKISFAALDVFNKEPLPRDSKLLKCNNILLTPHIGAYTEEAFLKASLEGAQRVQDFFNMQKVKNTLPLINDWGSLSFAERT